jgi:hypothetical protein
MLPASINKKTDIPLVALIRAYINSISAIRRRTGYLSNTLYITSHREEKPEGI